MRAFLVNSLLALCLSIAGFHISVAAPSRRVVSVPTVRSSVPPSILLKGGTVVNADGEESADVLLTDGVVKGVFPRSAGHNNDVFVQADVMPDNVTVVEVEGQYIVPGGVDPHVHLDMPFMGMNTVDDFYHGHRAALAGGTTMTIDFALPLNGSLLLGYENYLKKGRQAVADFGLHMAVTEWNEKVAKEMEFLVREKGVNSFKFFLAYKGELMISDAGFIAALRKCQELGAIAMVHAENGEGVAMMQKHVAETLGIRSPKGHGLSRPKILEQEATNRAVALATLVDVPLYVVHVMSRGAADVIRNARKAGARVIGEAVVAGLLLDEAMMAHENFTVAAGHVMSPPIRNHVEDGFALQEALATGDLQLVGTDHAVFTSAQKARGREDFRLIPNGVNGLEERMNLLWDVFVVRGGSGSANARISRSKFVSITSAKAAKIFNVFPRKGAIRVGSDADVAVIDPQRPKHISARTHFSRTDFNVFEGLETQGSVALTIQGGHIVYNGDTLFTGPPGCGRFIKTPAFSPALYKVARASTKESLQNMTSVIA